LRIELLPEGDRTARTILLELSKVLQGSHSEELDSVGNRMVIRRAADDFIRVQIPRQHLIFSPGEQFQMKLEAHRLALPADTPIRCSAELQPIDRSGVIWQQSYRGTINAFGSWSEGELLTLSAPAEEGVYELDLAILTRRSNNPFATERAAATRRVQFLVLAEKQPESAASVGDVAGSPAESRELIWEIDPSQANWWKRLTRLPQWSLLPGFRTDGPLGNSKTQRVTRNDLTWIELPVGGWQAYPLSIDEMGVPHELELNFAADSEQAFAVSIVEPNAAGKVIPVGVDSAVRVTAESVQGLTATAETAAIHRLTFWPRTRSPLLLITNLSSERTAAYGRFQVYRTRLRSPVPKRLTAETPAADGKETAAAPTRIAFAYWDRPLFPENFGASESLDVESGRSLEDWQTFFDGARRMVEYAQHSGYDGLAVMCASEGSTLYPSRLLQPTPKHDRGQFFSTGQDALRKDVMELLFRLCDRAGMQLVPVMEFATPLPILEQYLAERSNVDGVRMTDSANVPWHDRFPADRGRGAYYNPLNDQVQAAMRDAVRELVQRYAHHPSFAGVSISLRPDGFTQMPDVEWGLDPDTWGEFCREAEIGQANPELMDEATRRRWLDWRCQQISGMYGAMARDVAGGKKDARLYLAGARLIESRPIQRAWRPALPARSDTDQALRELGLDPKRLREIPNLVFLRPRLYSGINQSTTEAAQEAFNQAIDVDRLFQQQATSGSQFLHDPHLLRVPSFDELSPFGAQNTFLSLVAHVSLVGAQNRERFARALAREDSQVIFEGGWMLPMGQNDPVREFLETYRTLPQVPFQTTSGESRRWQPLTIRWAHTNDASYIYAVNESPWIVGATVTLSTGNSVQFQRMGIGSEPSLRTERGRTAWSFALEPYQVIAIRGDQPGVTVDDADVSLPVDVKPSLEGQIYQLNLRAAQLRNPRSLAAPENASFELWDEPAKLPIGWTVREGRGGVVREVHDVHEGKSAIRLSLPNGSLGLRSPAFTPPETGRMSISLRAKVPSGAVQPRVRLVLEIDGRPYYPWSPIGVEAGGRALTDQWKEFVFRVSQLPPVNESFRLGIECGGAGEVLIDDLKLYDILVLDNSEQNALKMLLLEADYQARNGYVADCLRLLNGYWPQYLIQNVPEVPGEMVDVPDTKPRAEPTTTDQPAEREASGWAPWRRLLPIR
jgi:hypothetical protein